MSRAAASPSVRIAGMFPLRRPSGEVAREREFPVGGDRPLVEGAALDREGSADLSPAVCVGDDSCGSVALSYWSGEVSSILVAGAPGPIRYARSEDGLDIAYTAYGSGDRDVVLLHGFATHLDLVFDCTWHAYWGRRLAERFRVIQFDRRGTGLSERDLGHGSVDDRMRDIVAVMDAAKSERASFVAISEGGPIALAFTSTWPDRVDQLVIYGSFARVLADDNYEGVEREVADEFTEWIEQAWGSGEVLGQTFVTGAPDPEVAKEMMAHFERNASSPKLAAEIMRRNIEIDVRALLPSIQNPVLVAHAVSDPLVPVGLGRYLADTIPSARWLAVDGDYHCTWNVVRFEPAMEEILDFLDGSDGNLVSTLRPVRSVASILRDRPGARDDVVQPAARSVATILFTDIVDSTRHAATLGDARWRAVLGDHQSRTSDVVSRCGGRVAKSTGDGVLAFFDGPSPAINAARRLCAVVEGLGIQIRAGVHTGEVEWLASDVAGINVHVASRVMSAAQPGEVLVSGTVKELVLGSGIEFRDRGLQQLKGVPGECHLYSVATAEEISPVSA